jgi:NAD(P)-dependent dehydrogenase (short-subunit alcohol dehydrogenase family)
VTAYVLKARPDIMTDGNPSQRIGSPEDVAGTAMFLSSRAGAYVNGATIALDGGHLVGSRGELKELGIGKARL